MPAVQVSFGLGLPLVRSLVGLCCAELSLSEYGYLFHSCSCILHSYSYCSIHPTRTPVLCTHACIGHVLALPSLTPVPHRSSQYSHPSTRALRTHPNSISSH